MGAEISKTAAVARQSKECASTSTDKLQQVGIGLLIQVGRQAIKYLPVLCKGYRYRCYATQIFNKL